MKLPQILLTASIAGFLIGSLALNSYGQDRGDRGGGRGGRGGGFGGGPPGGGGFGGGGFGGGGVGGGPPGGGGFGGGPPGGGGLGGGPPGGGGFGGGGFGGGPPGGGGFGGGGFGGGGRSMMDTNGNGMIDQEEIDRMPSFVRDMMKSRGIELKPGMSADDMRNSFRAGGGENNGWPGGPNNGGNGNSNPENVKPPLKPYKMKEKPPIIQALPPAYSEVDADFDGQLGLDEWMLARRVALEQFDALDTDHDGFLIPEELQAAEATATTANAAMAVRTEKLQIVSAKPAARAGRQESKDDGGQGQNNPNPNGWGGGGSGDIVEQAKSSFQRLDANQDGTVDTGEFQQSRRTRAMFEQAGIQQQDMNLQQFTKNLQKATEAAQANGGR